MVFLPVNLALLASHDVWLSSEFRSSSSLVLEMIFIGVDGFSPPSLGVTWRVTKFSVAQAANELANNTNRAFFTKDIRWFRVLESKSQTSLLEISRV